MELAIVGCHVHHFRPLPLIYSRRRRRKELVGDELAFNFDAESEKSRGETQQECMHSSLSFVCLSSNLYRILLSCHNICLHHVFRYPGVW